VVLRKWRLLLLPGCGAILLAFASPGLCQVASITATVLKIPLIKQAPKLEDFESMQPNGAAAQMQRITNFIQNQPSDGKPATERTEGYIGYDATKFIYRHALLGR